MIGVAVSRFVIGIDPTHLYARHLRWRHGHHLHRRLVLTCLGVTVSCCVIGPTYLSLCPTAPFADRDTICTTD